MGVDRPRNVDVDTLRSLLRGLHEGADFAALQAATGRTRSALYRDLAALRHLGVVIGPRSRRAGGDPPFRVLDWGVFRPERL